MNHRKAVVIFKPVLFFSLTMKETWRLRCHRNSDLVTLPLCLPISFHLVLNLIMIFFYRRNKHTHNDWMLEMGFFAHCFPLPCSSLYVFRCAQSIDFSFGATGRNRLSQLKHSLRIIHKLNNKGFIGGYRAHQNKSSLHLNSKQKWKGENLPCGEGAKKKTLWTVIERSWLAINNK